jgi:hypothetical protein
LAKVSTTQVSESGQEGTAKYFEEKGIQTKIGYKIGGKM